MNENPLIDEKRLRQAINVLKPGNQLFEVRILGKTKADTFSGYFTNVDTLLKALNSIDLRGRNCFITMNSIDPALYSRSQRDRFIKGAVSTSDQNVTSIDWLLIDVDPVRPADTSSTKEELIHSRDIATKVRMMLMERGFSEPICAASGNGSHLLFRVALKNTPENVSLIEKVLKVLAK